MAIFVNTDISQGSVATRLGCDGVFVHDCYKFPTESNSGRILKIGQYLVKLLARVRCLVFLTHSVVPTKVRWVLFLAFIVRRPTVYCCVGLL